LIPAKTILVPCNIVASKHGEEYQVRTKYYGQTQNNIISSYLDVLLGIFQVLKEGIITPRNPTFLIRSTIRVSIGHTTLSTVEATQIRACFVRPASLDCMTLGALRLEDLGTLRFVTVLGHVCCLSLLS
jgi:hypothetical protein